MSERMSDGLFTPQKELFRFTHGAADTYAKTTVRTNAPTLSPRLIPHTSSAPLPPQSCLFRITCCFTSEFVQGASEPAALTKPLEMLDTAAAISAQRQKYVDEVVWESRRD